MKNKIIFITGATSGIGKEAAKSLSKMGATVVITARDVKKGEETKAEIEAYSGCKVDLIQCNLMSLDSIRNAVAEFGRRYSHLDVLINNAGVWNKRFNESSDGIEETFAVNVVAPFLITALLLPKLQAAGNSQVLVTASSLHFGSINFNDIEYRKQFSGTGAYRQSKLAVILLARYLAPIIGKYGITINSIHPGLVSTNLGRNGSRMFDGMFRWFGISATKGADSIIWLASSDQSRTITGQYIVKRKVRRSLPQSNNLEMAAKLYETLCSYAGVEIRYSITQMTVKSRADRNSDQAR